MNNLFFPPYVGLVEVSSNTNIIKYQTIISIQSGLLYPGGSAAEGAHQLCLFQIQQEAVASAVTHHLVFSTIQLVLCPFPFLLLCWNYFFLLILDYCWFFISGSIVWGIWDKIAYSPWIYEITKACSVNILLLSQHLTWSFIYMICECKAFGVRYGKLCLFSQNLCPLVL